MNEQNEKQAIEEMANTYFEAMLKARGTLGSMNEGAPKWYAKAFYEAGYRKQSEGEWETETTNWVYDVKRTYCSNCRKSGIFDSFMGKYHLTNYCPNCGAKMKGGAE